MKAILCAGLVLAVVVCFTGCASIDTADRFNNMKVESTNSTPIAHINGDNYGLYLLPFIGLIVGDTSGTDGGITVFQDTVKVGPVVDMVTRKAQQMGATRTIDITSNRTSFWIFPTLFFWYKTCEVSATAVK